MLTPRGVVFAAASITSKRTVNENGKWWAQGCKKRECVWRIRTASASSMGFRSVDGSLCIIEENVCAVGGACTHFGHFWRRLSHCTFAVCHRDARLRHAVGNVVVELVGVGRSGQAHEDQHVSKVKASFTEDVCQREQRSRGAVKWAAYLEQCAGHAGRGLSTLGYAALTPEAGCRVHEPTCCE